MKTFGTLSLVGLASLVAVGLGGSTLRAQDDAPRALMLIEDEEMIDDAPGVHVIGPESRPAPRLGFHGRIVSHGLRIDSVDYDSLAFQAGLERGDVILEINGREIRSMMGYRRALLDAVDYRDGRVRMKVENVRWHTGESRHRYVWRTIFLPVSCHVGGGAGGGFDG
ncbi:MAG TPA: PDZ domain-containing protein [Pirellulaceae bacterium]|nr:PDZ domain-containing protein [Pirellulaceae bacterium]